MKLVNEKLELGVILQFNFIASFYNKIAPVFLAWKEFVHVDSQPVLDTHIPVLHALAEGPAALHLQNSRVHNCGEVVSVLLRVAL